MYTPKRYHSNRGDVNSPYQRSPYASSPYQSKDHRDTPAKGSFKVVEQADSHQLLTYGGNLPVKVAELLSTTDNANICANIESSGWAYIINNRKLYAWKTSSSHIKKTVSCFEFQVSATDVAHKASLTCLLESSPADSAFSIKTSLINISPEGVVRYWQNITHPAVMVETSLSIGDKKCSAVQSVMPYGCILVTTTNEMYFLSPSNSAINYHILAASSGMLSSIGKRMSTFWSQPVVTESNYPPCICDGTIDYDTSERYVFVALDRKLQKWEITGNSFGASKMVFQADLLTCVNNYAGITEFSPEGSVDDVETVDMKNTGYGTVLLLALWMGEDFKLVLGTLKVNVEDLYFSFERLVPVDYHQDDFSGNLKLLLPFGGYQAYISTKNVIISQPVSKSTRNPIKVEFNKPNSGIIGAGSCGSDAIYLSKRDGLVNLKVTYVAEPVLMEKSQVKFFNESANGGTSVCSPTDIYNVLRSAFISHSQGKMQDIENAISPLDVTGMELGAVIMKLSSELLDTYPPSDPRWASGSTVFPTSSVLLLNQLRDKEKIHIEYLNFISMYELLQKVGEPNDEVKIYLCENAEKIKSTIALLEMSALHFSNIVDDVINSSDLDTPPDETLDLHLSRKDLFFSKISNISLFFSTLVKSENEILSGLQAIQKQVDLILAVSQIFTTCFQAAWQYRRSAANKYLLDNHVPWTGSSNGHNNRELLKHQIGLLLNQGLPNVDSTKVGSVLTQQIVLLADILFDGYIREISALNSDEGTVAKGLLQEEYDAERNRVIMTLVNRGYYEQATTLAEGYKDFHMLIFLCEKTNDNEKLKQYKVQFNNEGFSNVLYKWYMEKGAWSQLMTTQDPSDNFNSFLSSNSQLSWLHFIGSKEFSKASSVLSHLAAEEKEDCARKKSMLVLANLAILAAEEPRDVLETKMTDIDRELELLNYHDEILKGLGRNPTETPPLSAEDLIQMSLDDDVPFLSEQQYVTLMELLQFITVNQQQILLDVWLKCILQDRWEECTDIDSIAATSQTTFYKCLKYWKSKGTPNGTIPLLKDLTASTKLADNLPSLLHQLKVCYEALNLQELSAGV